MTDAQSRYAIMEGLNNQKINEQGELSKLEISLDQKDSAYETTKTKLEGDIAAKKVNYKADHSSWKKVKQIELDMLRKDYERNVAAIGSQIADADETLEEKFEQFVETKNTHLTQEEIRFNREKKSLDSQIKSKKAVITQIDSAIKDLKDISKGDRD